MSFRVSASLLVLAGLASVGACNGKLEPDDSDLGADAGPGAPDGSGAVCAGPDPSRNGCTTDTECSGGELCSVVPGRCRASSCGCQAGGGWVCTDDCGEYRACSAPSPCTSPDPSRDGCSSDADCSAEQKCLELDTDGCRPSSCSCDASADAWICSRDCAPRHTCQTPPTCPGSNPAASSCANAEECGANEECSEPTADVCIPSACGCDAANSAWVCTADCSKQCRTKP